jgi:hypothetical protein
VKYRAWVSLALLTMVASTSEGGNLEGKKPRLAVGVTPYVAADFGSRPVTLVAVSSRCKGEWGLTAVEGITRRDDIQSVRLRWYLTKDEGSGRILRSGETNEFSVSVDAGGRFVIERELLSLLDIENALDARSKYVINVEVGRASFANGDSWSAVAPGRRLRFMHPSVRPASSLSCPWTRCNEVWPYVPLCVSNQNPTECYDPPGSRQCTVRYCG